MQVGGIYRFAGSTTTVRVVGFRWAWFRNYVKFETLYRGEVCGPVREVLSSYARSNWEPVDIRHSM